MNNPESSYLDSSFVDAPFDPHAATSSFHIAGNEPVFEHWLEGDLA